MERYLHRTLFDTPDQAYLQVRHFWAWPVPEWISQNQIKGLRTEKVLIIMASCLLPLSRIFPVCVSKEIFSCVATGAIRAYCVMQKTKDVHTMNELYKKSISQNLSRN